MALFAYLPLMPMWAKILGKTGDPGPMIRNWTHRALETINRAQVAPAHAREPHPSCIDSCRLLFTRMQSRPGERLLSRVFKGVEVRNDHQQEVTIRGHSAGSLTGLALEKLFQVEDWDQLAGRTCVTALACPFSLLIHERLMRRDLKVVHFLEDKLCIWKPSPRDVGTLRNHNSVNASPSWLDRSKHGYSHLLWVDMGSGHWTAKELEAWHPDFTPVAKRQSASYRLLLWCTYEIHWRDKRTLRNALDRRQQGEELAQIIHDLNLGDTETEAVGRIINMVLPIVGKAESVNGRTLTDLVRKHFSVAPFPMLVYLFCYFLPQFQPVPQVTPKSARCLQSGLE